MGGYFAVSTLLFYFSCDLHQSKKSSYPPSGYSGYEYEHRNHIFKENGGFDLIDQNRRLQLYDSG